MFSGYMNQGLDFKGLGVKAKEFIIKLLESLRFKNSYLSLIVLNSRPQYYK